jgi:signal peptidase II
MDFLDFHLGEYHWPAFNLADTFICIGALVLILPEILPLKFLKEE